MDHRSPIDEPTSLWVGVVTEDPAGLPNPRCCGPCRAHSASREVAIWEENPYHIVSKD